MATVPYGRPSSDKAHEFGRVRRRKALILWYLAHHGGKVEHPSGIATGQLSDGIAPFVRAGEGTTNFRTLLAELEADELILRDIRGKRTFSIVLVPTVEELRQHPQYGDDPFPPNGTPVPESPGTVVDAIPPPRQSLVVVPNPPVSPLDTKYAPNWTPPPLPDGADPHVLLGQAMTYIAQAIATSKPIERSDPEVLTRLASTLEDNQRLRGKLSATEDALRAARDEATALRKAKGLLEDNMRTIANGRLDEQALRRFRDLERMMQTPPNAKA